MVESCGGARTPFKARRTKMFGTSPRRSVKCSRLSSEGFLTESRLCTPCVWPRCDYPFTPLQTVGRKYREVEAVRVFVGDGFIDRYSGSRLVFPGVLRLLS